MKTEKEPSLLLRPSIVLWRPFPHFHPFIRVCLWSSVVGGIEPFGAQDYLKFISVSNNVSLVEKGGCVGVKNLPLYRGGRISGNKALKVHKALWSGIFHVYLF